MSFFSSGQAPQATFSAQGRRSTVSSSSGRDALQGSVGRRSTLSTSGRGAARDAVLPFSGTRNPSSLTRDTRPFGAAFSSSSLRRNSLSALTQRGSANSKSADTNILSSGQPMLHSQLLWGQRMADAAAAAEDRTPPATSGTVTPSSGGDSGSASYDDLLDAQALRYFEQDDKKDSNLEDEEWVAKDDERGFVRVHAADGSYSEPLRCTLQTTGRELADRIGTRWLFVQISDSVVRRLLPSEKPLVIQQQQLRKIGYEGRRLQLQGRNVETGQTVRFFDGKPHSHGRDDLVYLPSLVQMRQRKWYSLWRRYYCCLCGNRLFIFGNSVGKGRPKRIEVLTGATVSEFRDKSKSHCLLLSVQDQGRTTVERFHIISFSSWSEQERWKAIIPKLAKHPPNEVDLSSCSLEAIPDVLLYNRNIVSLNLTRNFLQSRPAIPQDMHEQPASVRSLRNMKNVKLPFLHSRAQSAFPKSGWLDDLHYFNRLQSLVLADNKLTHVPGVLYQLVSLHRLDLSANLLNEIPRGIASLQGLQVLHLHSNRLTELPADLALLHHLESLTIGFNRFTDVPIPVRRLQGLKRLHLAGNPLGTHSSDSGLILGDMPVHVLVSQIGVGVLCQCSEENWQLSADQRSLIWEQLGETHTLENLDTRLVDVIGRVAEANLSRRLVFLELSGMGLTSIYLSSNGAVHHLNCQNNKLTVLPIFYSALRTVVASRNCITELRMLPLPQHLTRLILPRNKLEALPEAVCDLSHIQVLDVSYNELTRLPARLFWNMARLRVVDVGFNRIECLPERIDNSLVGRLFLQHNCLKELPAAFLMRSPRLQMLNLTNNQLSRLPPIGPAHTSYQMQELFLTKNELDEQVFSIIAGYKKLRVLHLANNRLHQLPVRCLQELINLEDLVVSNNFLPVLPVTSFGKMPNLSRVVAHSNQLTLLGDLRKATFVKKLDVSCNNFTTIDHALHILSDLRGLDLSANKDLNLTTGLVTAIRAMPRALLEEVPGADEYITAVSGHVDCRGLPSHGMWTHGSAEATGHKSQLCAFQMKNATFRNGRDGLYGLFDGGAQHQISYFLCNNMSSLVQEEFCLQQQAGDDSHPLDYLKHSFLTAHGKLGAMSRRAGASAVVCHIFSASAAQRGSTQNILSTTDSSQHQRLNVANTGHSEAVLCRSGSALVLTKLHTVEASPEDCKRIIAAGGFITPEGRVNGIVSVTRLLGLTFLNPLVTPEPHISSYELTEDDELVILATSTLWQFVDYQEAVDIARKYNSASQAAKTLRDLAQSYGSSGNISIVVIFFSWRQEQPQTPK